jgi:hypothetical protein
VENPHFYNKSMARWMLPSMMEAHIPMFIGLGLLVPTSSMASKRTHQEKPISENLQKPAKFRKIALNLLNVPEFSNLKVGA